MTKYQLRLPERRHTFNKYLLLSSAKRDINNTKARFINTKTGIDVNYNFNSDIFQ